MERITLNDIAKVNDPMYVATIFSLGNGHLGVQDVNPIGDQHPLGTLVNGFYETNPIHYGEVAKGYAKQHQTIVNLPSLRKIDVKTTDGYPFNHSKLIQDELDLKSGMLSEKYLLSNNERHLSIYMNVNSVIDQQNTGYYGIRYQFEPGNYYGKIVAEKEIKTSLDSHDDNYEKANQIDPRKARSIKTVDITPIVANPKIKAWTIRTQHSRLGLMVKVYSEYNDFKRVLDLSDSKQPKLSYDFYIGKIHNSTLPKSVDEINNEMFEQIAQHSQDYWDHVWQQSEIKIDSNDKLDLALHYNLFQINQGAGRDGLTNVPSKGLSGPGYEGHYFWDTEMYLLPYFIYTNPKIAKQLLIYRYNVLKPAIQRARTMGIKHGALFAWRTINGQETSAYYPTGTAEYHIDGDVAYAVSEYFNVTHDLDFLKRYGYRIILETARFWANFGAFSEVNGKHRFQFFTVTGPDEYTILVDNNYYTNRLAKYNMQLAYDMGNLIAKKDPAFLNQMGTDQDELNQLNDIAHNVYLPYSKSKRINAQDDSFLKKPYWPKSAPKDHRPLMMYYHPLTIGRFQVAKQADTMLAEFLFPHDISNEQLKREYDYYEKVTTHDSSLSRSIFGILAARLNDMKKAYSYFTDTVTMDLTNLQGNTADGLHLANLGGTWMSIVQGFAGMQMKNDKLEYNPKLPKEWKQYSFRQVFRGRVIEVHVTHQGTQLKLISGQPLSAYVNGKLVDLR
ncbi:maltose phosphorylase [Philodulcilactobacillus myokoensis]|uniref:Maltose phosphorylase n=1 Tax=Philodulcilactobacillus myokoensis TaxID=2929573 RepID=A0A9W6ET03_9LACO|nr:glycosyl hydrolase family 65 protein [Philodulcilactobacillus myokoensis]GLB47330.1 maltose phosphorylase [Philodulcilactobacillus myokoensis]